VRGRVGHAADIDRGATPVTGTWSSPLVASFFHGERISYAVLAVIVGIVAIGGALTDSRATEESA
jgi:hypothetical protein